MNPEPQKTSTLDIPLNRWFPFNLETVLVILVLVAAIVSRFYDLGARTISHDEVNHVVPTFSLYSGRGYMYDPMSHGPLQFHMMALSYALFGDNDFTSRIPVAVFSVAVIAVALFLFRRYLGRAGAIAAGVLLLISPFMLYYGRYARNEAYIVLWGILLLYSVLRHLERGEAWTLFLFTSPLRRVSFTADFPHMAPAREPERTDRIAIEPPSITISKGRDAGMDRLLFSNAMA